MYSIGLDISKSSINVYIPKNNLDLEIANDIKSIKQLYSKLKKVYKKDIDKVILVFEPTANYSSLLKHFCSNNKIKCFIINPKQSSNFAKALGNKTKTDKIDARMLCSAISLAKEKEIKIPIINQLTEDLQELSTYRVLLVKQRTQCINHLESKQHNHSEFIIEKLKAEIERLNQEEEEIFDKMKSLLLSDINLQEAFLNIQTIKRVGEKIAIELIIHFIKYPNANKKQIVSLAGLEPSYKESGTSYKTRSRISKAGSVSCRAALFMAVFSYKQLNQPFIDFYERLKVKGKPTNVIKVALMRKILIVAHSIYKNNQPYNENKYLNNIN